MTLLGHLGELRSRLMKVSLAVVVMGGLSLFFCRDVFGFLMKPVLDALPPESRSLIYTSGIEEINVLMKVGLYCGLFLATPVLLWQIWRFVSPGLLPHERQYASPFVVFGSVAFVVGLLFGYYVLLPTMFQFLLRGETAPLQDRLSIARVDELEALRFLKVGDVGKAAELAKDASRRMGEGGDGQVPQEEGAPPQTPTEMARRLDGLGRLVDATHEGFGSSVSPVLRQVLDQRREAVDAHARFVVTHDGSLEENAATLTDKAASLLEGVSSEHALDLATLWKFERHFALAEGVLHVKAWTRPMLSMSEQLTLVLTLLLAMGVIFELPLLMALLASLGIVKASFLIKYQRHAFVVCLIIAAVVTPTGDAVNLSLMAGPMVLCYELGVLAAWLVEKRRKVV